MDARNIMRQVNPHREAHRERTAKPYSSRDGPAHVWGVSEVGLKGIEYIMIS